MIKDLEITTLEFPIEPVEWLYDGDDLLALED